MNLMISSQGESLESPPNARFGRSPVFIKYDLSDDSWQSFNNEVVNQSGGAGVAASQFMIDHDIGAVVSGAFGPNAMRALSSAGIKLFTFDRTSQTIREIIDAYKNETLTEVSEV